MDLRGQHQPARVNQDVALASGQTLRSVVAAFRSAHRRGLYELAVDHRRAGGSVAPFRLAHRLAKTVVGSAQPAVYPPLAASGSRPSARADTRAAASATNTHS
jgi:hypothetical protein